METNCFNIHQKIKRKVTIMEQLNTDVIEYSQQMEMIFQGKCTKVGNRRCKSRY